SHLGIDPILRFQ
ncbi:hypothetical protein D039_1433B, partial [Vibrio parahaemolyticus EKP-028]